MGKTNKKDLLSTEFFLLNFLLTHVIAGTKMIVMCAVPYGELLRSSERDLARLLLLSDEVSEITYYLTNLAFERITFFFFFNCLQGECHFLWQKNQHVTADFAVGFSE